MVLCEAAVHYCVLWFVDEKRGRRPYIYCLGLGFQCRNGNEFGSESACHPFFFLCAKVEEEGFSKKKLNCGLFMSLGRDTDVLGDASCERQGCKLKVNRAPSLLDYR